MTLREIVQEAARKTGAAEEGLGELVLRAVRAAADDTWPACRGRFETSWSEAGGVELRVYRKIGVDLDLETARRCGLDDPADPLRDGDELGLVVFYHPEQREARELQARSFGAALQLEQPQGGFGRRAAKAALRTLRELVRTHAETAAREAFEPLVGRVVIGIARRHERGALIVDVGGYEARLSAGAGGRDYRPGDRVVALVEAVRGRDVILNRAGEAFVRALAALEVPEIEEGRVEIVAVAREAARAKVAVRMRGDTDGEQGDAALALVCGTHGDRVTEIARALGDVQVDVIAWHPDPVRASLEALSGAEILDFEVVDDVLLVRVPESAIKQAVGRRGANARLAAILGGWRELRITSESEPS